MDKIATSHRFEDHLDGLSNYNIWKERIALLLEKNVIWKFVAQTQIPPTDAVLLEAHNKKDMKVRRINPRRSEGPYYPSYIREENNQRNVGGIDQVIPK